jgi:DNA-binding Xre family transcriptional regulator
MGVSEVKNKIPEVFDDYMRENGLNQTQLADLIGISKSAVSRMLRGERSENINLKILNSICQSLHKTPNDLLWTDE